MRMRFLLFCIVFLSFVTLASLKDKAYAITLDAQSSPASSQTTWTHTVGDHADRLLVVVVEGFPTGYGINDTVTYANLPLTKAAVGSCAYGYNCVLQVWYLVNPPVGANSVSVTSGIGLTSVFADSISYYNTNTTDPFRTTNIGSGTINAGSTIDTNLTMNATGQGDLALDAFFLSRDCSTQQTITMGTGQTQLYSQIPATTCTPAETEPRFRISSKAAGAGSTIMNWHVKNTNSSAWTWGQVSVVLKAPPTGPTPTPVQYVGVQTDASSNPPNNQLTTYGGSWQHTVGDFPNRVLLVAASAVGLSPSVTYNGNPMTLKAMVTPLASSYYLGIWALVNPPVGMGTIAVSGSGSIPAGAVSLYNVDPTNPFGQSATNPGSGSGVSGSTPSDNVSLTLANTTTSQLIFDAVAFYGSNPSTSVMAQVTPGSGELQKWFSYFSQTGTSGTSSVQNSNSGALKNALNGSTPLSWTSNSPGPNYFQEAAIAINPAASSVTPTPAGTYSISGNVFNDPDKNGIEESSESNYAAVPTITITPNAGTITANPNGSYVISGLPAGTYVVSYSSPPPGYQITSPLNGPPPSFQVTVGPSCNTNSAAGASCQ